MKKSPAEIWSRWWGGNWDCHTRTGKRFFDDATSKKEVLHRVCATLTRGGFWEKSNGLGLPRRGLDAVVREGAGAAPPPVCGGWCGGQASLAETVASLAAVASNNEEANLLFSEEQTRFGGRQPLYRFLPALCWKVNSVSDLKPCALSTCWRRKEGPSRARSCLATCENLAAIWFGGDALLLATPIQVRLIVTDAASAADGHEMVGRVDGTWGRGDGRKTSRLFRSRAAGAGTSLRCKCRGPEYLRIIYGPEYLRPENLERLRSRSVARKRSLALREFALGIEALERFVRREPLRRLHECVFGVLALESEPVDPRL